MNASHELEPGPSSFGLKVRQALAKWQGDGKLTREVLSIAQAVGWGGSPSG
jgi:hypothetical protein